MLYLVIVAPKSTSFAGTTSFDIFCIKIRSGVWLYELQEPKNERKNYSHLGARQSNVFGEQKPLNRSLQNFVCRVP